MEPFSPKKKDNPEKRIQLKIKGFLEHRGWFVMETHGNAYQVGFPDLWATHKVFHERWIEVKLPGMKGSKFTPAQFDVFPKMCKNGSGVWIMTGATSQEYMKLFEACNWWHYLEKGMFR